MYVCLDVWWGDFSFPWTDTQSVNGVEVKMGEWALGKPRPGIGETKYKLGCILVHPAKDSWTQFHGKRLPHINKQFSDASRMSENSTQFWHYLPRHRIQFNSIGKGLGPTRPRFTSKASLKVVTCASNQLPINQRFSRPLPYVWLIC